MSNCENCGASKKEYEEFEECVDCGTLICPNCVDTDPYGGVVCPACYKYDEDNYG